MIELLFYITKCSRPGEGRLIITPGGFDTDVTEDLRERFAAMPAFWISLEGDGPLRFDPEDLGPDAPGRQAIPPIPLGNDYTVGRWDNDWWYVAVVRSIDLGTLKRVVSEVASAHLGTATDVRFENLDFEPVTDASVMLS